MTDQPPHPNFDAFLTNVLADPIATTAYNDAAERQGALDALVRLREHWCSLDDAAHLSDDLTRADIEAIEAEGSDPTVATLQRYARALGVRVRIEVEVPRRRTP